MKATTRGVAALLTCIGCASSVAAQSTNDFDRSMQSLQQRARQEQRTRQAEEQRTRQAGAQGQRQAEAQAQRRGGSRRGGGTEATEPFSRTVRLLPGGTFDLRNVAGDVTVTGGGGTEARIEATKRVRNMPDARVQNALDQIRIEIAERGGNVEVRTLHPRTGLALVDYTVTLPENANIILRSSSGNLRVYKMAGDELRLNTLSGSIVVREMKGRTLDLHTVSGNMQVHDIAAQRALLDSMAGNLEYAGRLMPTGRYQFQTHRGDIRVMPSGNSGFDLEAMTYKGRLRSDFVLTLLQRPRSDVRRQVQRLYGTFGDAGAMLTASSFSGNIVIVKP